MFDSVIDGKNSNSLGYNANANYNRRIGAWQVGGYFNYAQNVQTILVTYNSSFYNFSGSVARRFGFLVLDRQRRRRQDRDLVGAGIRQQQRKL